MRIPQVIMAAAITFGLTARPAAALDPETRITQYRHSAWRVQDGAFESAPNAIAQTPDGYIWIGTDSGLVRFDGVRFQRVMLPDDHLSASGIVSLLSASDGTLWIGTATGLLSWKNDRLQQHVSGRIGAILEDHQRRIWVARSRPELSGGLCQIVGDHPGCIGGDDRMRLVTAGPLTEDVAGNLWIGAPNQLMRWRDGVFQTYFKELEGSALSSVYSLAAAVDGAVWVAIPREGFGVFRMVNGLATKAVFQGINTEQITSLFIDRDQTLWMGTLNDGVYKVSGERVDRFRSENGLSSNTVHSFFEDREGNVWVATSKGLDSFHDSRVLTFSTSEGLAAGIVGSVLATDDGTVWIGRMQSLDAIRGNTVTSLGVPDRGVTALFQDHQKRLWVGLEHMLTVYEVGQFRTINRLDGRPIETAIAITEDSEHNVWVSGGVGSPTPADRRLFRIRDLRVEQEFRADRVPPVRRLAADPTGGIWLGFEGGNVGRYRDSKLEIFSLPQGAIPGVVSPGSPTPPARTEDRFPGFTIEADGSAWISTWSGLVRWKNREMKTLTSRNGLPCDEILGTIRDDSRTLWLYTKCGLVAIADSELEQWWQQPDKTLQSQVLDVFDGAVAPQGPARLQPAVSKSPDGRLWFAGSEIVQMIDPADLRKNLLPPPVYVEEVRADRKDYATDGVVRFPARSRDIEIGYTALSFSIPQKVRFRYRLDGRDEEWRDAGTRRQVFYSDLSPGQYRFHVTASNNDGVWNDSGATVDFAIAPAYYQTTWFMALSASLALTLVWGAHRVRLRLVERHRREISALNERLMNAQEQERIRIAGELHDGVMQEMFAATMMLGTAKHRIGDDSKAKATIEKVQQKLIQTGTELRQLSHELHPPILQDAGLPQAVVAYCEQFSAMAGIPVSCDADEHARDLSPGAALALFRIVQEALGNAAKHSQAKRIRVGLMRSADIVSLVVSDDGVGFEANRLSTSGGLGLITMRERATQLNGKFEFESAPGRGTTMRVIIPFR